MATAAKADVKGVTVAGHAGIAKISGIDACDEYLHAYERCVAERLRGDDRATHSALVTKLRTQLTARAKDPERASSLEARCKHGVESLPAACAL